MSIVIDCSVTMAWCFEDEASKATDQLLDSVATSGARVPDIWLLEVANVLLVAERRRRLKRAESERFITLLQQLPIDIERDGGWSNASTVLDLARTQKLSSYDAAYLSLALRSGSGLATMDKALAKAAKALGLAVL